MFKNKSILKKKIPNALPCASFSFQDCKMSCQSFCVGVLWRQPSATWHATRRASCSVATMTAGAGALLASQNATVLLLTSRSWRRTWKRAKRRGKTSTKSSWNQVWVHVSKQAVELQLSYKEVALKDALVSFLNCFGRKMLHLTSECV